MVKLVLPTRGQADASQSYRSALFNPTESGIVTMVLPDNVKGCSVRLELPRDAELVSLALGERQRLSQ